MNKGNHPDTSIAVSPEGGFDVVLRPHRSLGPTGFVVLMAAVAVVSFVAGMAFLAMGAWPVAGFFGLDAALIYLAFRANYGAARAHEHIALRNGKLILRRIDPRGSVRQWQFEPYWVRLRLETQPSGSNRLLLTSHGRTIAIAACLGAEERAAFAAALRQALAASMPGAGLR